MHYDLRIAIRHPNWSFCVPCGEWFTSDSAFDAHLGPIPKVGRPKCKAPASARHGGKPLVYDEAKGAWKCAPSDSLKGRFPRPTAA
jgi:hypothetical protein